MDIIELKESLADYLARIANALPNIVSEHRLGKEIEANEQMILLVEGLSWVTEAIKLTQNYHNVSLDNVVELFAELNEALENGDRILVADLLEYELLPKVNDWRKQVIYSQDN